jgi:hypothetical protein
MDVAELSRHLQNFLRKITENLGQDYRVLDPYWHPVSAKHEAGVLSTCTWSSVTIVIKLSTSVGQSLCREASSHSYKDQTFITTVKTSRPQSCITHHNMLEDNPISAVRICVFSIRGFLTAFHIQKPYCPSATRGRAIPWTQGPTYQGVASRPYITAPVTYEGTVLHTYRVSAHPLTWEWEQILFFKRCLRFWTQGKKQGPQICDAVTYHRQKAFFCRFGIHHCVWR